MRAYTRASESVIAVMTSGGRGCRTTCGEKSAATEFADLFSAAFEIQSHLSNHHGLIKPRLTLYYESVENSPHDKFSII
jgi:hypothetical protein